MLRLRAPTLLRERSGFSSSNARRHRRPPSDERLLQAQHGADASFDPAFRRRSAGRVHSEELDLMQLSASIPKIAAAEPFIVRIAELDSKHYNNEALLVRGAEPRSEERRV